MNDVRHGAQESKKLTVKQALIAISLSVFLISGSCFFVLSYYQYIKEKQKHDDTYQIVAVIQTSPDREGLKTGYLTEILELAADHPRNLYDFDIQEAVEKLLNLSVIKEAKVRKIRPGAIHVDYVLRKPIAYVGDYSNTAIDADGVLFPFKPFYTPKKLPEIIFGDEDDKVLKWGNSLTGKRKELAFTLLQDASEYNDEFSSICCIDVSKAFAPSDGQRQIVLILEDRLVRVIDGETVLSIHPRILRLRQDNYKQQLGNYRALRTHLREIDRTTPLTGKGTIQQTQATIIDMRLSKLAFFSKEP